MMQSALGCDATECRVGGGEACSRTMSNHVVDTVTGNDEKICVWFLLDSILLPR